MSGGGTVSDRQVQVYLDWDARQREHLVHDIPVFQSIIGHTSVIAEQDFWPYGHREFGLSTYDSHIDGSGVHHSSALRPLANMRPKLRMATGGRWQFPAGLHLVRLVESRDHGS